MPTKLRAVEVIPGKFWITYDEADVKSGTLKFDKDATFNKYEWLRTDGRGVLMDDDVFDIFEFEDKTLSSQYQRHLFGYPIPESEVFKSQERDNLPVFTKSANSKIYFAAGYYIINYPINGWAGHFCPKTSTLRKNDFLGPFKSEADMNIILKRKIREDGQ